MSQTKTATTETGSDIGKDSKCHEQKQQQLRDSDIGKTANVTNESKVGSVRPRRVRNTERMNAPTPAQQNKISGRRAGRGR